MCNFFLLFKESYTEPITIHRKAMSKGASDQYFLFGGYLTYCTKTLSMANGGQAGGEYKVQKILKQTVTNQLHRIVLSEKFSATKKLPL